MSSGSCAAGRTGAQRASPCCRTATNQSPARSSPCRVRRGDAAGNLIGSGMGIASGRDQVICARSHSSRARCRIGTASDAAYAFELGCDAVLVNRDRQIARPRMMAAAMRAAQSGRAPGAARRRIPKRSFAEPSAPARPRRSDGPRFFHRCMAVMAGDSASFETGFTPLDHLEALKCHLGRPQAHLERTLSDRWSHTARIIVIFALPLYDDNRSTTAGRAYALRHVHRRLSVAARPGPETVAYQFGMVPKCCSAIRAVMGSPSSRRGDDLHQHVPACRVAPSQRQHAVCGSSSNARICSGARFLVLLLQRRAEALVRPRRPLAVPMIGASAVARVLGAYLVTYPCQCIVSCGSCLLLDPCGSRLDPARTVVCDAAAGGLAPAAPGVAFWAHRRLPPASAYFSYCGRALILLQARRPRSGQPSRRAPRRTPDLSPRACPFWAGLPRRPGLGLGRRLRSSGSAAGWPRRSRHPPAGCLGGVRRRGCAESPSGRRAVRSGAGLIGAASRLSLTRGSTRDAAPPRNG